MSAKTKTPTAPSVPVVDFDTTPPAEAEPTGEPRPCSKCGLPGYPYCKACRANYQRDYVANREQMAGNYGFAKGVKTFREMIAAEFARLSKVGFVGAEIAHAIMNAPTPLWPADPKPALGSVGNGDSGSDGSVQIQLGKVD